MDFLVCYLLECVQEEEMFQKLDTANQNFQKGYHYYLSSCRPLNRYDSFSVVNLLLYDGALILY